MEDLGQESNGNALDIETIYTEKNIISNKERQQPYHNEVSWSPTQDVLSPFLYVQLYSVRLDSKWPRKFRYHKALYEG